MISHPAPASVDQCLGLGSQDGLHERGRTGDGGTLDEIAEGQLPAGCALGADDDPAGRSHSLNQLSHRSRMLEFKIRLTADHGKPYGLTGEPDSDLGA